MLLFFACNRASSHLFRGLKNPQPLGTGLKSRPAPAWSSTSSLANISYRAYFEAASPAEQRVRSDAWGALRGPEVQIYNLGKVKTFGERVLLAVPDVPAEHADQRLLIVLFRLFIRLTSPQPPQFWLRQNVPS